MIELSDQIWRWIESNMNDDPNRLRLSNHGNPEKMFAIDQIDARKRTAVKHRHTLKRCPRFLFDSTLAAQQSTSDDLAYFHASIIHPGSTVLDMTGGLGIDALYISDTASNVTMIEIEKDRCECARQNFDLMNKSNISVLCGDSTRLLAEMPDNAFDYIFIDPARRGAHGERLFALSMCKPDVTILLPEMLRVAHDAIIKASPMLDVTQVMRELPRIKRIISLGTPSECKELVIICGRDADDHHPSLEAVTISDNQPISIFVTDPAAQCHELRFNTPAPKEFLYDPYPSFAKLNLSTQLPFDVCKIAQSSNLYSSHSLITDFPGQPYFIDDVIPFNKHNIKEISKKWPEVDVTTRNFPLTAQQLTQRLKTRPSGRTRLFATTDSNGARIMIIGHRHTSDK